MMDGQMGMQVHFVFSNKVATLLEPQEMHREKFPRYYNGSK